MKFVIWAHLTNPAHAGLLIKTTRCNREQRESIDDNN